MSMSWRAFGLAELRIVPPLSPCAGDCRDVRERVRTASHGTEASAMRWWF
jgi:hypothetical protein